MNTSVPVAKIRNGVTLAGGTPRHSSESRPNSSSRSPIGYAKMTRLGRSKPGRDATAGPRATYQRNVAPATKTVPLSSRLRHRSGLVRGGDGKAKKPAQATG